MAALRAQQAGEDPARLDEAGGELRALYELEARDPACVNLEGVGSGSLFVTPTLFGASPSKTQAFGGFAQ